MKLLKWTISLSMIFLLFQTVQVVNADDDHDEEREKYEGNEGLFQKWVDDDEWEHDDEDEWDDDESSYDTNEYYNDQNNQNVNSYWNIWTRDTSVSTNGMLPVQEAQKVQIKLNNKEELFYVVPLNGQLLVPCDKVATFLGAKSTFYEQSRILVVSKGQDELIVRMGSNAAYENMVKTPMPTNAIYMEKSIYLPISVIANSLGIRVNWDETTQKMILESI